SWKVGSFRAWPCSWKAELPMASRRPIIAANWKMHKTHLEAIQAVQRLSYLLDKADTDRVEVVICSPFTALRSIQVLIEGDRLEFGLGAQNVHWEEKGAFTGEISPTMLAALKCRYVILRQIERLWVYGENEQAVAKKVPAMVASGRAQSIRVVSQHALREGGRTEGG